MAVHRRRRIVQNVVFSDAGVAEKCFEHRVVRLFLPMGTAAFFVRHISGFAGGGYMAVKVQLLMERFLEKIEFFWCTLAMK